MRLWAILMFAAFAGPSLALPQSAREPEGLRIYSPTQFGSVAETPSRITGSREEMNRGRNTPLGLSAQEQAADAVVRAGLVCVVAEAAIIGRTRDGGPLIEIDCVEGGGVIIADTNPIQITDCLDLAPDTGQAGRRQRIVTACQLPGNRGLAEQARPVRN